MADYSLVPVDYQPDFENVSLVPVDYNPFADSGGMVQQAPAQAQIQPTQVQLAQNQPQGPPQQPATGPNQPSVNGPPVVNSPAGSSGGATNNPASDQGGVGALPFNGFANPTPAESLVNQAKMNDQRKIIDADQTGENGFTYDEDANADEPSAFVTTKKAIAHYLTPDHTGQVFTQISPFYVKQGSRHAIIDASPERPVTVTIQEDGKFTISRP
jgi:hypothetical protein